MKVISIRQKICYRMEFNFRFINCISKLKYIKTTHSSPGRGLILVPNYVLLSEFVGWCVK
jgi:hypothetical protein